MTFWGGSGSADPCLWSGSGSCYFRHWPSRCQQKTNFLTQFFLLITFWEESKNSRNQGFSYYFCMMIEGSGSIPLISGSGPEGPKTCGSGGSGSATLPLTHRNVHRYFFCLDNGMERCKAWHCFQDNIQHTHTHIQKLGQRILITKSCFRRVPDIKYFSVQVQILRFFNWIFFLSDTLIGCEVQYINGSFTDPHFHDLPAAVLRIRILPSN